MEYLSDYMIFFVVGGMGFIVGFALTFAYMYVKANKDALEYEFANLNAEVVAFHCKLDKLLSKNAK